MEDKNKKSETAAHSPGRKSLIIALIVIAALLIAGILLYGSRKPAGEAAAQTGAVQSPAAPAAVQLSPELLRDEVLSPALAYHPGTAGSSLSSAAAAAAMLRFASDNRTHLEDQAALNRLMADAAALLTAEEQAQLQETLPDLIAFTEDTLAVYPENRGVFEDAGCAGTLDAAMKAESVKEDWAVVRTALEAAFPQG